MRWDADGGSVWWGVVLAGLGLGGLSGDSGCLWAARLLGRPGLSTPSGSCAVATWGTLGNARNSASTLGHCVLPPGQPLIYKNGGSVGIGVVRSRQPGALEFHLQKNFAC